MKRSVSLIGVLALLVLLAPLASAQETRGSIEGVVRDSSGAVLPGVTVEARAAAGTGVASAVTDTLGVYRFPSLMPGVYEVTANLTGFGSKKVENIQLLLGQILKVNFALSIAGVTETVQVTADSPLIDVKQNAASVSIQSDLIDRIPKGRNFTSVITTAPGANQETRAGGLQIDGSSGSENRYVVDGLDATSLRDGTNQRTVLTDFVSEVQVKSSGYNAEYRAATGGVVNAVTKSGANALRGEVGAYYSDDKWLGDVRQSLRLVPTNQTLAEYTATPRDPAYTLDLVASLGGPVLRDKLWFFAGYGPQYGRQKRTVTFTNGGATRSFRADDETRNLNYNVTSQLSTNVRAKFAGSSTRVYGAQSLPGKEVNGTSTSNPALFPNPLTSNRTNDSYVGEVSWVVSPRFFVNTNLGYLTYDTFDVTTAEFFNGLRHTFSQPNTCTGAAGSSSCPFPEIPAALQQLANYADNPTNARNVRDKYGRLGANVDATYYGNFAGQHTLKGGLQLERLSNDVLTGAQAPTVAISWNASRTTLDDPPRVVRGRYGYYTVSTRHTEGKIHANNIGIFVQDAWTVNNKLTLNLGLRGDSETIPSYRPENPSLKFTLAEKLAPRVGFAYDVNGDGKWKAYGSWGMFYDISKLEMPRGAWGAEHWIDYHHTLETFNWPSINCDGLPGSGCPGTFIEEADRRHVSNDPNNNLIDPDLDPVRTQEFTVGLDHELNRTMSVSVRYAHKWLDKTIEDVGIQVAGVGEVFMIANPGFGIAEKTLAVPCPSCPAQPPAKRIYDGLEFRLQKRLSNSWSLNTSYLWSRLHGNYSGLSSSDENGRNSPSVNRFFDGLYMSFDEAGQPVYGPLGTDRPHQFKLQATYDVPWGTTFGVDYFLASGTPQGSTLTYKSVPVFDDGRINMGRSPVFSNTNLFVQHDVPFPGRTRLNVGLNVTNLFDQEIATRFFTARYRDAMAGITDAQFFQGFDSAAIVAARLATPSTSDDIRPDARFGQSDQFQGARSFRVQAKFIF
jgi:outer membrane receptor protein involved in Fe transport